MIRLFNQRQWSLDSLTPPWGNLGSIYAQVSIGGTESLPDDHIVFPPNKIKWVGGAMDGVLGRRSRGAKAEEKVFAIVSALQKLQQKASNESLKTLYELVAEDGTVGSIDSVLQSLGNLHTPADEGIPRLLSIGRYLATRAGHREAVKFGIALIGVTGTPQDLKILNTLGRHEEFTLFAAVALRHISPQPEKSLWELAREVHAWGRIQIVRRLENTQDPEIQAWMLREGFRNNVMDEYLACICARTGRLHEVLNHPFVEDSVFDAAVDILRALINGGPAEDIDDYEFAADACESYVNLVWARLSPGLKHFLAVSQIRSFLEKTEGWEKRRERGWTDSRRQNLQTLAADVCGRGHWRGLIKTTLSSDDEHIFFEGDQAAEVLSIDTWDVHFSKVKSNPVGSSSWYRLMKQTDESRIDEVLSFAETVLPLEEIETGTADSLGLGPEFQLHGTLDWILQDLRRFPKRGWRLIRAGLGSPVIRNRNMAIQALTVWPFESWTDNMKVFIKRAHDIDPDSKVQQRLQHLLTGTPISEETLSSDA